MSLLAHEDEIRSTSPKLDKYHKETELMLTKKVYGNEVSLMYATRPPGYHSFPHTHDAEQLNYCLDGEIWIVVEEEACLLKKGDFSRVPRGKIHWAWNRSDKPVTLLEAHTPPLIAFPDAPEREQYFVGLFAEGEESDVKARVANVFHEEYRDYQKRVEARLFASEAVSASV